MQFEWNVEKAVRNVRRHGVLFEEAQTVFDDPLALIFEDERHSANEQRELIIGYSSRNRLLFISFTERFEAIRIISAREAARQEHKDYEENSRYFQ